MIVNGRDKPIVQALQESDGGLRLRIDFRLRLDAWVEIVLTPEDLVRYVQAIPKETP